MTVAFPIAARPIYDFRTGGNAWITTSYSARTLRIKLFQKFDRSTRVLWHPIEFLATRNWILEVNRSWRTCLRQLKYCRHEQYFPDLHGWLGWVGGVCTGGCQRTPDDTHCCSRRAVLRTKECVAVVICVKMPAYRDGYVYGCTGVRESCVGGRKDLRFLWDPALVLLTDSTGDYRAGIQDVHTYYVCTIHRAIDSAQA